mmetsp:Transcript_24757/g.59694  ORF Transcript_24757/g.59694 Transcript_24757/m.59694 type:complete len:204 (+) Transcript_24757:1054-1665(+)
MRTRYASHAGLTIERRRNGEMTGARIGTGDNADDDASRNIMTGRATRRRTGSIVMTMRVTKTATSATNSRPTPTWRRRTRPTSRMPARRAPYFRSITMACGTERGPWDLPPPILPPPLPRNRAPGGGNRRTDRPGISGSIAGRAIPSGGRPWRCSRLGGRRRAYEGGGDGERSTMMSRTTVPTSRWPRLNKKSERREGERERA